MVSKRKEDGQITHRYLGKAVDEDSDISNYQMKQLEKMHNQYMDANFDISRLETKVIEQYEERFWPRFLKMLTA